MFGDFLHRQALSPDDRLVARDDFLRTGDIHCNHVHRHTPDEFEATIPAFDLLTGSAEARTAIAGGASAEDVVATTALVDATLRESVLAAEARLDRAAI